MFEKFSLSRKFKKIQYTSKCFFMHHLIVDQCNIETKRMPSKHLFL